MNDMTLVDKREHPKRATDTRFCGVKTYALRRAVRRGLSAGFVIVLAACSSTSQNALNPSPSSGDVADASPWRLGIPPAPAAGFSGGVVAASDPRAAAAGAEILKAGGNAVDAAAATLFALGVVEPQSSGIGGGAFIMVYDPRRRETWVVDARETAPAAASPDMFADLTFAEASTSGVAVGVPGLVRGLDLALDRWGTRSMATVLAPAIRLAQGGFPISHRFAESLAPDGQLSPRLSVDPGNSAYDEARRLFAPEGMPLTAGTDLAQPALAATLRQLAAGGANAFYECDNAAGIARAIVQAQDVVRDDQAETRGRMTCEDLHNYQAIVRSPLVGRYRGFQIVTTPPPSSGGLTLLQMLAMLERFPLGDAAQGFGADAPDTLVVMQEAMRLAFADRAKWMGDIDGRKDLPVVSLIAPAYLSHRADTCPDPDPTDAYYCVRPDARLARVVAGDPWPFEPPPSVSVGHPAAGADQADGGETTHIAVIDRDGMIVTATSTVEAAWGTGLMVPHYDFLLNNQLTDFNLRPVGAGAMHRAVDTAGPFLDSGANDVAPGRRPRSSMAPTLIMAPGRDGWQPVAAYGSPGGATIINTVFNTTLDLIDHRMTVDQAIAAARLSLTSASLEAKTLVDPGEAPASPFPSSTLNKVEALGYALETTPFGSVQAVVIDPASGLAYGGADARREGTVIGLQ